MYRWLLSLLLIPTMIGLAATTSAANATGGVDLRVDGVIVSTRSRSALVNGQMAREGEKIDGVEILSIDGSGIRVLNGSQEYWIDIGSGASVAPSVARVVEPELSVVAEQEPRRMAAAAPSTHRVAPGDTLSEIATQYVSSQITSNQVILAIFEANPHAFDGNINKMRANVDLMIPDFDDFQRRSAHFATNEVLKQTESWRNVVKIPVPAEIQAVDSARQAPKLVALESLDAETSYGPVQYGETLSGIALQLAEEGVSMHRMMSALYDANPKAFGGSVDFLREGAVLKVPQIPGQHRPPTLAAHLR